MVNLGKIANWLNSLANFHFRYLKAHSGMDFIFLHLVWKESFGQIWIKITFDPLDLKISILVLVSQIMVFYFVDFECKKKTLGIFW